MSANTIIHIYVVAIWVLVATTVLLAISNYLLWSHLLKLKSKLSGELLDIVTQLIDVGNAMDRINSTMREGLDGETISTRRPGNDNPRTTH